MFKYIIQCYVHINNTITIPIVPVVLLSCFWCFLDVRIHLFTPQHKPEGARDVPYRWRYGTHCRETGSSLISVIANPWLRGCSDLPWYNKAFHLSLEFKLGLLVCQFRGIWLQKSPLAITHAYFCRLFVFYG